jgi:hypothetical protein
MKSQTLRGTVTTVEREMERVGKKKKMPFRRFH